MKTLPRNAETQAFIAQTLQPFPRPDQAAADAIRHWARDRGLDLNPDKVDAVTLYYQLNEHGWVGRVAQKMTLTQAVLANWQGESTNNLVGAVLHEAWAGAPPPQAITLVDQLHQQGLFRYGDDYQVYNGLYRQTVPAKYSRVNHVKIPAEDFQRFIWQLDFKTPYKADLKAFWTTGIEHYRLALKAAFLGACNQQLLAGSLSEAGKQLAWQAAGIKPMPTWRSLGLRKQKKEVVQVSALDVYGYVSSDILYLRNNASQLTLLYIPGNSSPIHEFSSPAHMKAWLASQCQSGEKREALQRHFQLSDLEDGTDFSGLRTALLGLGLYPEPHQLDPNRYEGFATSGIWDPQTIINYRDSHYSQPINDDLFESAAQRQKKRSYQDADFIITSDSSVTKARWRGYLNSAINTLAPLALLAPELAPLLALGGTAQFGLALDQLLQAQTQEQRLEGIENQVFGVLNALPLLESVQSVAPELLRIERPGFNPPHRINGQIGYPLSPPGAPRLPQDLEALAPFFPADNAAQPLPGADPQVAGAIIREHSFKGTADKLVGQFDHYLANFDYSYELNAFRAVRTQDYYVAPTDPGTYMVPLTELTRVVSDEQRLATLRALGVRVKLPVNYTAMHAAHATAIPKKVSCIWTGRKIMGEDYLESLANNASLLKDSQYRQQLFLSTASPEAYATNYRNIKAVAPTCTIHPLEQHPAFTDFAASRYFPQYQAALAGNGGVAINEASATDILRYRILKWEGGLYMDCDDLILLPGVPALNGEPAQAIDQVALNTDESGLLVSYPVSDQRMGMYVKCNNSLLGSHPGNPLLDRISDEILARYGRHPDFYNSKPDKALDLPAHQRWCKALSHMTGPDVLNDMIDQHLPALSQLREICAWFGVPRVDLSPGPIDPAAYEQAVLANMPLTLFARINSASSWE
ncbi:DUF6543 domain-containing protein [Pseudomonas sp. dw_358]|uniref:dermonecrotic toxin domain-containing protein n=1 Tax=Pseudomonas sp. dw_358 TaxID=2720083 RepID=UPI001BD3FBE7|nr:DUF6543 domain-containing protein [Pseudomonas sp. dw_358]